MDLPPANANFDQVEDHLNARLAHLAQLEAEASGPRSIDINCVDTITRSITQVQGVIDILSSACLSEEAKPPHDAIASTLWAVESLLDHAQWAARGLLKQAARS